MMAMRWQTACLGKDNAWKEYLAYLPFPPFPFFKNWVKFFSIINSNGIISIRSARHKCLG